MQQVVTRESKASISSTPSLPGATTLSLSLCVLVLVHIYTVKTSLLSEIILVYFDVGH